MEEKNVKAGEGDKKSIIRPLIESLIVGALIFVLTAFNLLKPIDYLMIDSFYQSPRGIYSKIKIIAVDETTLEQFGRIDTWDREIYGRLVDILNTEETKPAVIAFDILFSGNVSEGDRYFADSCKAAGNVVTCSEYQYSQKKVKSEDGLLQFEIKNSILPFEELRESTCIGFSNVSMDTDGKVRRVILEENYNGDSLSVFSYEIYKKYCENTGASISTPNLDKYGRTLINYSGKPGDYEAVSLSKVLDGTINPKTFKGSIVLVGAYASGMQDNFEVPNGKSQQMYGVEIHANILQSFMQGRFAINGSPVLFGLIYGVAGVVIYLLLRNKRLWIGFIVLSVAVALQIYSGIVLNNNGICVSLLYFPLVLTAAYIYWIAVSYVIENAKKRKVLNAFKKYVDPEIVSEIAKKGDFNIKLGGQNKDIAVLFVDIRGFTTMSEALEPETVVEILNRYLTLTTKCIFRNKGTLDKFVGDATMAVFNSPFDLEDYEYKAVCAAMDIVDGGNELEKELYEKYGRSVGFGVGVNCGPAVVGNVGCDFRMDYTAIGDTVNTAARLEANAPKGKVYISEEVKKRLGDRIETEDVGQIPLKGKSNGIFVYSVTKIHGR